MKTALVLLGLLLVSGCLCGPVFLMEEVGDVGDMCGKGGVERSDTMLIISTSLGYISIACWVIVTLPQLYINWKTGSAEAIAVGLLFCWVSGDILNLIGCYLVHQLFTQKVLAAFYVVADVILIGQMIYYIKINPPNPPFEDIRDEEANSNDNNNNHHYNYNTGGGEEPLLCSPNKRPRTGSNLQMAGAALVTTLQAGVVQATTTTTNTTTDAAATALAAMATVVMGMGDDSSMGIVCGPKSVMDWVGLVMAWLSAALYLSSRLPQIYKNWQRKSVEGLSLGMFALAVGGNLTYSLSIYLGDGNPSDNLPYLVGSTGTMLFDFVVFGQFWLYQTGKKEAEYEKIPDGK